MVSLFASCFLSISDTYKRVLRRSSLVPRPLLPSSSFQPPSRPFRLSVVPYTCGRTYLARMCWQLSASLSLRRPAILFRGTRTVSQARRRCAQPSCQLYTNFCLSSVSHLCVLFVFSRSHMKFFFHFSFFTRLYFVEFMGRIFV